MSKKKVDDDITFVVTSNPLESSAANKRRVRCQYMKLSSATPRSSTNVARDSHSRRSIEVMA